MKKEHPILFSAPMVRAILDGKKTQTRRLIKLRDGSLPDDASISTHIDGSFDKVMDFSKTFPYWKERKCPYGVPGGRLWVRETWAPEFSQVSDYENAYRDQFVGYNYAADFNGPVDWNWRPSIHMPRAASRIMLEITEIRVQRLHDITEQDAYDEGFEWAGHGDITPTFQFMEIWKKINGPESWDANPWVWCISFNRI